MKNLLISIQEYDDIREEVGLEMIASFLRKESHIVKIIVIQDANDCEKEINQFEPDIVGISAYLNNKDVVIEICKKIKKINQKIFIGIGGYLPSYYPEEILNASKDIDVAIIGEGELIWSDLVKRLEANDSLYDVKGIAYILEGQYYINEPHETIKDMDMIPIQCRDMMVDNKLNYAYLSTSRGCEKHCTFCCSSKFWKNENGTWKGKCIEKIIEEIEYIIKCYGIHTFHIQDNSFEDGMKENKVMLFAREVIRRNLDISYHLNIRAEFYKKLNKKDIEILKLSGLVSFFVGIESDNKYDLKLYGKTATIEDNHNAMELYRDNGVFVDIGFINFNPYSTAESLRSNINFLGKYNKAAEIYLISSRLMIFKGTSLYTKIQKDGLIKKGDFADYYRYNYINENIGFLAEYTHNIFEYLIKECNYSRVLVYALRYRYILENLKRRVTDLTFLAFINEIQERNNSLIVQVNDNNVNWFNKLIDIVTDNWDIKKADEITDLYLNKEKINYFVSQLEKSNGILLKELIKYNKKYLAIYKKYI